MSSVQIDVMHIKNNTAVCNLYTENRCVRIVMHENEYENLLKEGFFIREGKNVDSAEVLNTTATYYSSKVKPRPEE
jgi:hypothetical protein